MRRRVKPPHVAERGVYLAPFTANGDRHYYAVDSRGERIDEMPVPIGADPMEAIDALWIRLERDDPVTHSTHDVSSFSLKLLA